MDEFELRVWDKERQILREVCSIEFDDTGRKELVRYWDHPSVKAAKIKSRIAQVFKENTELMKYTGLKDKNGKKRFQDDIIRRSTGYVFIEKEGFFSLGGGNNAQAYGYNYHPEDEVIGNVWENPELVPK